VENTQVGSGVPRLLESLGELPEPVAEPTLIVISGLPGTGKSYFSKRLAEKLPFLVLESDALRKMLFASPSYSPQESAQLFQTIHQMVRDLLHKGISLILDATNLSERSREQLYSIADQLGIRLVLVRVVAPPEVVYQRLKDRARDAENRSDADWEVYRRMQPSAERIRRNHYVVDTSRDINPALDKIVRGVMRP
jgi:predicted kinase